MNEQTEIQARAEVSKSAVEPVVMAVTGYVTYDVKVTCPHCEKRLHLNQYPYNNDEEEYTLAEDELGLALFGMKDKPAKWEGLDIQYKCCGCQQEFTVGCLEP